MREALPGRSGLLLADQRTGMSEPIGPENDATAISPLDTVSDPTATDSPSDVTRGERLAPQLELWARLFVRSSHLTEKLRPISYAC